VVGGDGGSEVGGEVGGGRMCVNGEGRGAGLVMAGARRRGKRHGALGGQRAEDGLRKEVRLVIVVRGIKAGGRAVWDESRRMIRRGDVRFVGRRGGRTGFGGGFLVLEDRENAGGGLLGCSARGGRSRMGRIELSGRRRGKVVAVTGVVRSEREGRVAR
jgi:hypothetical protein